MGGRAQAYEELWEVLIRQYLKQQAPQTIEVISSTLDHLIISTPSLAHINQAKAQQLDEQLLSQLVDFLQPKPDLDTSTFDEEEIESLKVMLLKIVYLIRSRDLRSALRAEEVERLVKPLDLIYSLALRGRLGDGEEAKVRALFCFFIIQAKKKRLTCFCFCRWLRWLWRSCN